MRRISPVDRHRAVADRRSASRRSRAATWWTTIVYWWRSSSASANTYGSSSPAQNSASVHQNAVDAAGAAGDVGRPVGSSGVGGA